mmetsp:Transcript_60298/g.130718  ORF Transcript_60298/g.130718 Transcript_60298/m.130718 type:complete len:212 (-) Transcript_60298:893-1528(-)
MAERRGQGEGPKPEIIAVVLAAAIKTAPRQAEHKPLEEDDLLVHQLEVFGADCEVGSSPPDPRNVVREESLIEEDHIPLEVGGHGGKQGRLVGQMSLLPGCPPKTLPFGLAEHLPLVSEPVADRVAVLNLEDVAADGEDILGKSLQSGLVPDVVAELPMLPIHKAQEADGIPSRLFREIIIHHLTEGVGPDENQIAVCLGSRTAFMRPSEP